MSVCECAGVSVPICACACLRVCVFNQLKTMLMAVEAECVELKVESRAQCQRNRLCRSIWAAGNGRVAVTI